jgi:hypothetical protein
MAGASIDTLRQRPAKRDLRGIMIALLVSLAMWGFLLMGVLGLVLKILH